MARGNFGNPQQHSEAGKKGAQAQPTEAKAKGGKASRGGGRKTSDNAQSLDGMTEAEIGANCPYFVIIHQRAHQVGQYDSTPLKASTKSFGRTDDISQDFLHWSLPSSSPVK